MKHFAIAVIAGATVSGALTGAASAQTTTTTAPATSTTTPISYVGSTSIGTGLQCLLEGISALTPGGTGFSCFI